MTAEDTPGAVEVCCGIREVSTAPVLVLTARDDLLAKVLTCGVARLMLSLSATRRR